MKQPPEVLRAPAWDESLGPVPFCFSSMPKGHRCLWTARWMVGCDLQSTYYKEQSLYLVQMSDWERAGWDLPSMTEAELRAELEDLAFDGNDFFRPKAGQLLLDPLANPFIWRSAAEALLRDARQSYREYIAPWNPPADIKRPVHRPGWKEARFK